MNEENAFEFLGERHIGALDLTLKAWRHKATGARHFHLECGDRNNAFLVALPTWPQDSTGVAHILEHTVLCGSERYPVRDPFFMMLRRSLNSYMNACTGSDFTAYPFATANRKDYDNLLSVYLDAVFFPLLHELDFAQEGWRLEFEEPEDPTTPLVYRGVVYNEMKGAMSSPIYRLWQDLQSGLFPTTTYHWNSGGEPEEIPKLSHAALKAFHASHYHPSNAVFLSYGSFPPEEHQRHFHEWALSRFGPQPLVAEIGDERPFSEPQRAETRYDIPRDEETGGKTHIVTGWLLGHSAELDELLAANLLNQVLLGNSSAPLRQALETTDLGAAPSELCGLEDSYRQMVFVCGLEGSEPDRVEAVERLILETLERVAAEGVPEEAIEAALHQIELGLREPQAGRESWGLQLMWRVLPTILHDGDPFAVLDLDPALARLREAASKAGWLQQQVRRQLLDNAHRLTLVMRPEPGLNERREAALRQELAARKERMSEQEKQTLVGRARALRERQQQEDDPEVLPRLTLDEIPPDPPHVAGEARRLGGLPARCYGAGTNGLFYLRLLAPMPSLEPELLGRLPLFWGFLNEVGCGDEDYLATARRQALTGMVGGSSSIRPTLNDCADLRGWAVFSGKALGRNLDPLASLLEETIVSARFDEHQRLRELVAQDRLAAEASVVGQGHTLAMIAASACFSPLAALQHRWDGLAGVVALKELDRSLEEKGAIAVLGEELARIRERMADQPLLAVVVDEPGHLEECCRVVEARWGERGSESGPAPVPSSELLEPHRQAWVASTQVSFCARAWPAAPAGHPDAAAFWVLGQLLTNGFLHGAVREQGGAYGGGAGYDADAGVFRMYSYRDPRLFETLEDFDRSLEWLARGPELRLVEEAILGVIRAMDKPSTPAGEALRCAMLELHGRDLDFRRRLRQEVLSVDLARLQEVAGRWLRPDQAATALVVPQAHGERLTAAGYEIHRL
ncbi:MAG: peptidase M16 [Gammaproteobacteria bacterium]|nr:MAG: peptidase M16 [Gammaproteobacteria bacterium]